MALEVVLVDPLAKIREAMAQDMGLLKCPIASVVVVQAQCISPPWLLPQTAIENH